MRVCVYICVYVYAYICIYIHMDTYMSVIPYIFVNPRGLQLKREPEAGRDAVLRHQDLASMPGQPDGTCVLRPAVVPRRLTSHETLSKSRALSWVLLW